MPIDRARTARGALAGAIAAGAWSAQAQLDMRAFGVDYSDEMLLGKAVTRGPAWPAVGFALHLLNGAAFGAAYANVAPRLPLPSWARGPVLAMVEHLSTWPMTVAVDRAHPARKDFPVLWGNNRAFAQATLAPPVLRHRPGRARAPLQRPRRHRDRALRARRVVQRPRRHRARGGRVATTYAARVGGGAVALGRGPRRSSSAGRAPLL